MESLAQPLVGSIVPSVVRLTDGRGREGLAALARRFRYQARPETIQRAGLGYSVGVYPTAPRRVQVVNGVFVPEEDRAEKRSNQRRLTAGKEGVGKKGREILPSRPLEAKPPPQSRASTPSAAASNGVFSSSSSFQLFEEDTIEEYEASAGQEARPKPDEDSETNPRVGGPKPLKINADLLLYKARQLRRAGQTREAESIFRRIVRIDATDGRAYVSLAKMAEDRGDLKAARKWYERGIAAVGGDNPFLWQAWAVFEARRNNFSRARDLFDSALVADERHAPAWHAWGIMEKRCGDLQKARNLWVKGARLCPGNAYLYQSLALLEADSGRLDQARQYFMLGVRASTESPALWQSWALMEADAGNEDEARRLFERGIKECPRNRYLWLAYGLWEARKGGPPKKARELLERGAELNRRDPAIWQAWALFEYEQGDVEWARQLFEKGLKADAKHQPVWQAYAMMESKEGNAERARELYQRGVWADPQNPNAAKIFQAWGVMEDRMGNHNVARSLFKCAIKADSSSVPAWLAWAQMEERQGNIPRAEELRLYCLQQRVEVELDLRPADTKLIMAAQESLREDPDAVRSGRYYRGKPLPGIFDQIAVWFAAMEVKREAKAKAVQPVLRKRETVQSTINSEDENVGQSAESNAPTPQAVSVPSSSRGTVLMPRPKRVT